MVQVGADDTMLRFAVINGLHAERRNHVTQALPTTWEGLVSSARVGEMCVPVSSIQDKTVSAQLELIQEQLRQLQADKSKTETASSTSTVVDRRSKSPPLGMLVLRMIMLAIMMVMMVT